MAKKTYSLTVEKIYRTQHEITVDLDELRDLNEFCRNWTDEEILNEFAENYGCFDSNNDWELDETNVRTITNVTDNKVIFEN